MVGILRKLARSLDTTSNGDPIYIYVTKAYEAPPSNPALLVSDNLHYEGRQVDFQVRANVAVAEIGYTTMCYYYHQSLTAPLFASCSCPVLTSLPCRFKSVKPPLAFCQHKPMI
jgi:hypothetical protein